MDAPVHGYQGYLTPHLDRILAMHADGASTGAIAEALYRRGVRADTTSYYIIGKLKREHHIVNLRAMVLHVLQRHGLRIRRRRIPRWPKS